MKAVSTKQNPSYKTSIDAQKEMKTNNLGVCFLVTDIDTSTGGVQSITLNLIDEYKKRGVRTYICSRNYYKQDRDEVQNEIVIHRSPAFPKFLVGLTSVSYLVDGLRWLIKNKDKYDVIHCQQIFAPAMLGLLAKYFLQKPVLVAVHRSGDLGEVADVKNSPTQGVRVRQFKTADFWTVLSEEMRGELESLGVNKEKIELIPNATFIPERAAYEQNVKEEYRKKLNISYKKCVIFTGRLSVEKGLTTLVSAWKKINEAHPEAHLLILGKGGGFPDVETEIKDLAKDLSLTETIHFLGFKSNANEYLLASDIFVLPSLTEGMSVAIIEAMAAGLAMVVTDIPANEYLCQDNVNSLKIPTENSDELAGAINNVLADPELQERLGRSARDRAMQDLSIEIMADRYLGLYSDIINKNK